MWMQLVQVPDSLEAAINGLHHQKSEWIYAEKAMKFRNEILAGDFAGHWNIMKISCPKFDVDVV